MQCCFPCHFLSICRVSWVYPLPSVGLAHWTQGRCWYGAAAWPWIQLLWKKLCEKELWEVLLGFIPVLLECCVYAQTFARCCCLTFIAAMPVLGHIPHWARHPLVDLTAWFGCRLASVLQTCQQSGLLLLIAATRTALLFFFRYCKSVPLLMKPLPALLPGSPSLMEQPVLAAPCWFSGTFLSPEPSTKEPGLWAVQNLSPTSQSALRVLAAFLNP